ncbi:Serpentine receptor class gamma [Caenorhabditis elegans]|uniref:Serpentine receptor class gamma n=1 Tax=Caenorhabditis elegans TaxID=6239 RepID=A0A0B7H0Y9_CAEEL|nr:Serpentine receptor class gamma [Caenorhabditis elegans]CEN07126.2 Serpentine receptor class gamma [Caenorhabditis elegans]|eukprot:NP_001334198.1 Serpentine Receptor, class E (epsilon) [Caenorhabditis elegans]
MLLIHYVNLTHFKTSHNEFWLDLKVFLAIECVLYFIDLFNMIFNFVFLIRAHQFHFNFGCIYAWLFVINFTDNIALLLMKNIMIWEYVDDSNPTSNWLFFITMNITIACTFAAMCTLFFCAVERCFATVYICDYEKKQRKFISIMLNSMLTIFGFAVCGVVTDKKNTVYLIIFLLVIDGIALMLHCFLQWLNKRIYVRLHDNVYITSYSLAQRFQVAENIVPTDDEQRHLLYGIYEHDSCSQCAFLEF